MDKLMRVLVIMVTDDGDDVSTSVKAKGDNFTLVDREKLKSDVKRKLLSHQEDALYFRIRYNEKQGKLKGITESLKVKSADSLLSEIDKMFAKLGVVDD